MPKFQKISSKDSRVTFTVFCDDGHMETQTYALANGESEKELMARVALHINTERKAVEVFPPAEVKEEPLMEVSVSNGKVTAKEVAKNLEA